MLAGGSSRRNRGFFTISPTDSIDERFIGTQAKTQMGMKYSLGGLLVGFSRSLVGVLGRVSSSACSHTEGFV